MGIKGLWAVLAPYSEKKSLYEIRGETIAVDLSGWVCDSQNVTEYYVQPKLYLRNLFFRTAYLILADVIPIFVLEGDAPELKRDVMAARNQLQFRGAAPRSEAAVAKKKPDVARKRFKNVLKECESLLKCLGVRCIKGLGEAEATCAALNEQNLVDAVVSQDSDCFAYGARRVYRNFSVSNSAGGGALQGSVDCYDADKMYQNNGFGRKKMVALAILCGCDYGVGACGSSINTAVSFLHTVPEHEVIPRLLSWVTDVQHFEEQNRWLAAPGRCDRCGHFGRTHGKNGCPICVTHRGCNDTGHKTRASEVKRELSLRNRALTCGSAFPEPKVMKEFLNKPPEKVDLNNLKIHSPSLIQFVKLMTSKLDWSERYCVEKFLPLLTKWHLQDNVPNRTIQATVIKKKRNPRGVPSFEVVWGDIDTQYEELIPDEQFEEGEDHLEAWTTIERQDLMRQYYPDIVEAYEQSIKKPLKEKKTRTRKTKETDNSDKPKRKYNRKPKNVALIDDVNESMKDLQLEATEQNTSALNVSVSVNKLKRKIKNNTKKGQKTLTSFIASKKRRTSKKQMQSLTRSFKNISLKGPNEETDREPVLSYVNNYLDDLFDGMANVNTNIGMSDQHSDKHNEETHKDPALGNINNYLGDLSDGKENVNTNIVMSYHYNDNHNQETDKDPVLSNVNDYLDDLSDGKENVNTNIVMCYQYSDKHNQKTDNDPALSNINDYLDDLSDGKENVKTNKVMSDQYSDKHYLSMLNQTDDGVDEGDLSDIINKIVTRPTEAKTATIENKLVRLVYDKYSPPKKMSMRKSILFEKYNNCSTPNDSPIAKRKFRFSINSPLQNANFNSTPNDSPVSKSKFKFNTKKSNLNFSVGSCNNSVSKINTSYFFDKLTEAGDAFEMSLEHKSGVVVHLDSTVDYSLPEVRI